MTIDETPRGSGRGGESPGMGRSRTTARDLERYAGLFAQRTQGMKSSAMRDLMAITARPEVISLAGGLPDTSSFPAEDVAALMSRVAADASARALQYGPTEGMDGLKSCIVRVMAEEGMDVGEDDLLVTTGGQQVIDLVCKTLIDPGDVIVAEGPTYPGAVPTFGAYEADVVQIEMDANGMRIDVLEEMLQRLDHEGRTPKFIYTVPTFQNPAGVTMGLDRRRRLVRLAAERELLVLEDNPYGLLRYEGDPLPPLYALDGGEYVVYLGTFSKILSPGLRLGWTAAPRPVLEKLNLGKQGADLCSSTFAQHFVIEYFASATGATCSRRCATSTGGAATRCSTRSRSTSRPRRTGRARAAVSSSGRPCLITSTRPTFSRAPCGSTWPSCPAAPRISTAAAARRCG